MIPEKENARVDGQYLRRMRARRRLVKAADELFEENGGIEGGGYEATTIDMIVERAQLSRRTFFNHFKTKADALIGNWVTALEDHLVAFKSRPKDEHPLVSCFLAFDQITEDWSNDPINLKRAERAARLPELAAMPDMKHHVIEWENRLAKLIAARLKGQDKEGRGRLMARIFVAMHRTATETHQQSGRKAGEDTIIQLNMKKYVRSAILPVLEEATEALRHI